MKRGLQEGEHAAGGCIVDGGGCGKRIVMQMYDIMFITFIACGCVLIVQLSR